MLASWCALRLSRLVEVARATRSRSRQVPFWERVIHICDRKKNLFTEPDRIVEGIVNYKYLIIIVHPTQYVKELGRFGKLAH